MSINELRTVLQRAAALFRASGAKSQAQAVDCVERLLADSKDETVVDFVSRTQDALSGPKPEDLTAEELALRLDNLRADKAAFAVLFTSLQRKEFTKSKAIQVASIFTGARPTAWSTKPQALKAIKRKFDDRVYLASKEAMNAKVTPW